MSVAFLFGGMRVRLTVTAEVKVTGFDLFLFSVCVFTRYGDNVGYTVGITLASSP